MRGATSENPYEVYCRRCNVSFPVGTRACMHCGHPIGRATPEAQLLERAMASDEEGLRELPLRAIKASPMTIVWVVAAVATVAYRACQ